MTIYLIYKFTFPNNKIYIGQTGQEFDYYMNQYKSIFININHSSYNRLINKSIRKYGWNNVKKEIICTVSEEFIDDAERYFIKLYNSTDRHFGYNIEEGGNKNKIGCWKGKKRPEQSKRMSGENNSFYNKKHTEKSKEKISIGNKNKKRTNEFIENIRKHNSIPIIKLNKDTNLLLEKYNSVREASKKTKIDKSSISKCLSYKRQTAGGYVWRYVC